MAANFAKYIFAIRPKPDHTHVGALREEGVVPKISRNNYIFAKFAKINVGEKIRLNGILCVRSKFKGAL